MVIQLVWEQTIQRQTLPLETSEPKAPAVVALELGCALQPACAVQGGLRSPYRTLFGPETDDLSAVVASKVDCLGEVHWTAVNSLDSFWLCLLCMLPALFRALRRPEEESLCISDSRFLAFGSELERLGRTDWKGQDRAASGVPRTSHTGTSVSMSCAPQGCS